MSDTGTVSPQLKRTLGLLAVTAFGVGDILGAGVYGLVGKIAGTVGCAAWMSYVLAGLMAALTGLTYAEWTSRHPRAGGAAHFCETAYRTPLVTFLVIFFVALSGLFSMATASRIFANYALAGVDGVANWWREALLPGAFVFALALVAMRGIKLSSAANAVCTVIEVSGLLIIIALAARFVGRADYLSFAVKAQSVEPPMTAAALAVVTGASVAFYAFVGFEDLANLSEETHDPERVIPLGICLSIVITSIIYCAIAVLAVSVLPPAKLAATDSPLLDLVRAAAPRFPAGIYAFIPGFAVFNTALLNLIMASRLLYGMSRSRSRLLPSFLGRLHTGWHTPVAAILLSAGVVVALIVVFRDVKTLAAGTSSFLLVVFILLHAGLLVIRRRPGQPAPRFRIPGIIPVLGILTGLLLLARQDPSALKAAARMTALALGFYLVLRTMRGKVDVEAVD